MKCQIKNCRTESEVIYFGKEVCQVHFEKHCDGNINLKDEKIYR